jgi:hypothetical protein
MILWITIKQVILTPLENNGVQNPQVAAKLTSLKKIAIGHDIPIDAVK